MSILSTNQRLIKVDVGYSAGNGIDITSGVISVTGDNAPYSAGQNIYFDGDDNHVINGKDWGEDINAASANAFNEASAWVASNYANSADLTYLSGVVDNKLDTSAWSSVSSDLATEQYVIANGNMVYGRTTAWVNDQNYSTVSQLESVSGTLDTNKLDASSYHELTAGENIDIQDYVISSKDWTNDIQNASANAYNESTGYVNNWIEETYSQDKNVLSGAIDYVSANAGDQEVNSLVHSNSGEWNNVSSKLDENVFQEASGLFLTAIPQEYITESELPNYISAKLDTSSFASVSGDFLVASSLNGYATESFVQNVSGDITALIPTDYYPDTNPSGFITGVDLSDYYKKTDTSSKEEISAAIAAIPLGDEEVNQAVHTNSATWNTVTDKLDTTAFSDVSGTFLTAHQDLSDYATTAQLESTSSFLSGAIDYVSAHGDNEEVTTLVQTNSGTWNDVSSKLDESVYASQSGTFLTAQQNADWTATAGVTQILNKPEEVSYEMLELSAGPGIDIQDTNDAIVISSTIDVSNKLDTTAFADVSSTFLTNDDITGKLDTSVYAADSATFLTAIPATTMDETLLNLTNNGKISGYNGSAIYSQGGGGGTGDMETALLEYNANDQITGYDGSAFAAGDVPEGTMVESNLEYNSQGYINGYNGSAVATIDQERQWFTHDDTLCHISNSAQYALGINMSAISADLARMMGVDETVLLDRGTDDLTAPNTAQLSEPFSAFEKIEIWSVWNPWPTNVPQATYYPGTATNGSYMVWDNSQYMRAGYGKWAVNGTTFQLVSASQTTNWPTFDSPQTGLGGIRKIVGIGRKN